MKHCKIILLVGLLASSASALAEKIGVSMAYFDQNFLTIIRQSIEKEAQARHVDVQFEDARGDTGRQADQVQSFIASGVDAIIVDPVDSASTPQLTKMAQQAKMPLVYVNRTPGDKTLPPGVVMGYRSSMPIIELKLTGPADQRDAMLALWPEVRKVAGDSLIFEGTEGLPAQIARCLQERQLSLTLSEQFTGGLLALQLSRAGAPLLASEVVPAQEETLAQAARWAAERRINHFAGLALAVSGQENDHLNVALATPDGTFALRVKFSVTRHSLAVRQEVCAMMALNMLRRWLNGQPLASEHGWINVVDSLSL